jgi:hypothetical protein
MSKFRLIGDVHGDMGAYLAIIDGCERSIQVGDFGIGFVPNPIDLYDINKHEFIRGNHDYPEGCKYWEPNYIQDGTVRNDVMFVGGAYSIDWAYRTPGRSWWDDEECSVEQLQHFIDVYTDVNPRVMICHECPESIAGIMCGDLGLKKYDLPSRTRDALQVMFEIHQPEQFWFGHWHKSWGKNINGTNFRCLNINEYADVELDI